jgi:hypothetical protein
MLAHLASQLGAKPEAAGEVVAPSNASLRNDGLVSIHAATPHAVRYPYWLRTISRPADSTQQVADNECARQS